MFELEPAGLLRAREGATFLAESTIVNGALGGHQQGPLAIILDYMDLIPYTAWP